METKEHPVNNSKNKTKQNNPLEKPKVLGARLYAITTTFNETTYIKMNVSIILLSVLAVREIVCFVFLCELLHLRSLGNALRAVIRVYAIIELSNNTRERKHTHSEKGRKLALNQSKTLLQ